MRASSRPLASSMLRNKARRTILSKKFTLCESRLRQARGLMFSSKKDLIFVLDREKYVPLHMFFVFFPIDVLFLDKNKRVVDMKERFRPFTLYHPKALASHVLELQAGTIASSKTMLGDEISWP
jgi:uncharacterized membrane protein (UPF0127 family)